MAASGPANGQWKGGRSIASNGYVLIRVGKSHHLADVRGYAYEHRLVAEQILGRRLESTEQVHYRNEIKTDNSPENLIVCGSIAAHRELHRRANSNRQRAGEPNQMTTCECGCGAMFLLFDKWKRPRAYVSGHNYPSKKAR